MANLKGLSSQYENVITTLYAPGDDIFVWLI